MYVEFEISEEDLSRSLKSYFFKKDFAKRLLLLIIVSYIFGRGKVSSEPFNTSTFILRAIIAAVVLTIVFFIAPYFITLFRFKKSIAAKRLTQPQKITLTDEGINITSENENNFWKWETLKNADIVDEYLFFTLFTRKLYLIPLRYFSSNNEAINFLGVVKSNITKFRGQSKPRQVNNLYYWGLVGFIPNFGVIAGIVLIVKGFQYNEIKLMLVGVTDILLTVLFWTTIFPHLVPK